MRPLTSAFVKTVRHSGRAGPDKYGDQHGLMLRVMPTGGRQWIWRGTVRGKRVDLGLGGWPYVSLSGARQTAFEYRKLARDGGDPRSLRSGQRTPTFSEAAMTVIGIHEAGWKDGGKSANQWRASLRDYAIPKLGKLKVSDISTADVMAVLLPVWNEKPETARRVRQRIGAIMKWAVAQGHRQDNPAGDALEYLILTASRSGEVRKARSDEVDLETATWTVPADRMKMQREHRVPLSERALQVLAEAREWADGSGLIFPSVTGRPLSDNTLSKLLREQGIPAVVHGFRSSFRDWCAECSNAPREVSELALAHVNSDRVEAAYMRTDLFQRRRALMQSWADYISEGGLK